MIYDYMINNKDLIYCNEGFLSKAKAASDFKILKARYEYLVNNNQLESSIDEIDRKLKAIKFEDLNKVDQPYYTNIRKTIDNIINKKKAKLKADSDNLKAWISKFKDAPTWTEKNTKEVVNYINSKIIPILLTTEFKKEIRDLIDKGFKSGRLHSDPQNDGEFYNNNKIPKIKASVFEPGIIEILPDASQEMRLLLLGPVTSEIAVIFNADTGDGDEGCIYI